MMLEDFGLEPERFRLEWIASSLSVLHDHNMNVVKITWSDDIFFILISSG